MLNLKKSSLYKNKLKVFIFVPDISKCIHSISGFRINGEKTKVETIIKGGMGVRKCSGQFGRRTLYIKGYKSMYLKRSTSYNFSYKTPKTSNCILNFCR